MLFKSCFLNIWYYMFWKLIFWGIFENYGFCSSILFRIQNILNSIELLYYNPFDILGKSGSLSLSLFFISFCILQFECEFNWNLVTHPIWPTMGFPEQESQYCISALFTENPPEENILEGCNMFQKKRIWRNRSKYLTECRPETGMIWWYVESWVLAVTLRLGLTGNLNLGWPSRKRFWFTPTILLYLCRLAICLGQCRNL